MKDHHGRKKGEALFQTILTLLLFSALVLVPLLTPRSRPQDIYAGWADSEDPCFPVKQMKKYWREHYNREADFLQCIPLRIIVEWDIEENYMRRPGIGNDRAKLLLREEFPAYLELTYDPENLKRLEAFNILGPSPCCPGNVDASLLQVNASMLACYSGGSNCRMFTTSDPLQFQVIPPSDNFFSFTWRQDIKSRSGGFGSSLINFQREALPRSMNTRRGIGGILHEDNFRIKVSGEDAFGWDEIQTGLKEGELFRVFPIDIKSPTLTNDFYSQQGKAVVSIQFGEEELETWRVSVEGWEKDTTQPPIEYQDPSGAHKKIPLVVDYGWLIEGEFFIGKRKQARYYKEGRITQVELTPRDIYGDPELYRCEFVDCQNKADISSLEGGYIDGKITDSRIKLTWPTYSPAICVLCTPRVSYLKKIPYRGQFGTKDFMRAISQEDLQLRDGYSITGGIETRLYYKITLTKLK